MLLFVYTDPDIRNFLHSKGKCFLCLVLSLAAILYIHM